MRTPSAFSSDATNLVAGDTKNHGDVFVLDRAARTTERVSIYSSGAVARTCAAKPINFRRAPRRADVKL